MSGEMAYKIGMIAVILVSLAIVGHVAWQQWKIFRKRERREDPQRQRPKRSGITHPLKMGGGRASIMMAGLTSGKLVLTGWFEGAWRWQEGDYLMIFTESGFNTRYMIDRLTVNLASSLYIAECTFAPRGAATDGS